MNTSEVPLLPVASPLVSARLAVQVRNASVIYQATDSPVHALAGIDLDINEGEFVALIGPSGCGKTTLMRVIADLEKTSAGQVLANVTLPLQILGRTKMDSKAIAMEHLARALPADGAWTWHELLRATMAMPRPVLPAPHQVALDFWSSLVDWPLDSPRNLLFHVAVTAESTLWGFVLGTALGLFLSVCIVHCSFAHAGPGLAAVDRGVANRAGAGDCDVPVLFPGDGGHGAGPALAATHRDRNVAHLCRHALADPVAAAPAGCLALLVSGAAGLDADHGGGRG